MGIIGLLIGSFLNVVIVRLPVMLMQQWPPAGTPPDASAPMPFNLCRPRSQCDHCQKPLRWYHNLPLLSFFSLRGRCAFCHHPIAWQYPVVESLTALITALLSFKFGWTLALFGALIFSWTLIAAAVIDFKHHLLPDQLTLFLLWIGLLLSLVPVYIDAEEAILSAAIAYSSLWSVNALFQWIRKQPGMGHGDFKLFAALAAFLGLQTLPFVLLLAVLLTLVYAALLALRHGLEAARVLPFGTFLSLAGLLSLLF